MQLQVWNPASGVRKGLLRQSHGSSNYWVLAFDILRARMVIPIPPAPSRINLNLTRLYLALRSILDLSPTVRHSHSQRPAIRILDSGI
jgi:hypothetical protein